MTLLQLGKVDKFVWVFCLGAAVIQLGGAPDTFPSRKAAVEAAAREGLVVLLGGQVYAKTAITSTAWP